VARVHFVGQATVETRNLAFYYPGPIWQWGDQIKNAILFFDGVALLVPDYLRNKPVDVDPAIATGLLNHGLLEILSPEEMITKEAADRMAGTIVSLIESGAIDAIPDGHPHFAELSMSRLGYAAAPDIADTIFRRLHERGFVRPSEDGVSIPMHPIVRNLILVLWSQFLRPIGRTLGMELSPLTDRPEVMAGLVELLGQAEMPSAGHIVQFDLKAVGVDLSSFPLEEVLQFRESEGVAYRRYSRDLQSLLRALGPLDREERTAALRDRRDELAERALALRQNAKQAWKKDVAVTLGLAGAAWALLHGDVLAGFAAGASAVGFGTRQEDSADAYSYLLRASAKFPQI